MKYQYPDQHRTILTFLLILAGLSTFRTSAAQDISTEFWPTHHLGVLHDFGHQWETNSIFKPYRWERVWRSINAGPSLSNQPLSWLTDDLIGETESSGLLVPIVKDTLNVRWWNGGTVQQPIGNGGRWSMVIFHSHLGTCV